MAEKTSARRRMLRSWKEAIGNPEQFVHEVPALARRFAQLAKVQHFDLKEIREFVHNRNDEIGNEPEFPRVLLGAFAVILIDYYGQRIRAGGLFRRRVRVESKRFQCDLDDLFYRCVFEGLDLAPPGEALAS